MSISSGVALVIGAGSDDGSAVAHLLVRSGCRRLILGDRDVSALEKVVGECHHLGDPSLQIISERCNTNEPSEIDRLIAAGVKEFGEINCCANCERPRSVEGRTAETLRTHFVQHTEIWQRGIWLVMRAEIRQFLAQKEKGNLGPCSIVNVAAAQGLASDRGFPGYCAAAHGIVGMTRATAMDYVAKAIRVNCVCPGPMEPIDGDAVSIKGSLPPPPIGRYIATAEVAQAVVFLLGDGATAITGIDLPVDGGWSLYHH
ncbi:uncharacterized protein Z519_01723 [Cladophialophora bantiana CBS 173.52]|uniref:SDR family oxidoreductase n=1 Tax=Cladophialophora bantiana (strain ATCC 10958 / CBS 173.52 / CDC B-1940 / NIH 8579) TaxID=1442370 RepID=A0A0D2IMY1_CLAB1|nr:uncharacterized protein Z519_01723 [Cladophialophora bantiana CBS 173.52]KIW98139.1 hypothetical protein Z519_01723 [Cladophialophora bantiana CBS 173.52]